jgi:hypothetical protein
MASSAPAVTLLVRTRVSPPRRTEEGEEEVASIALVKEVAQDIGLTEAGSRRSRTGQAAVHMLVGSGWWVAREWLE